jgi:hypothetical protein
MTREEKIAILKENIPWKPDIPIALEKLDCKVGVEIGVRIAGNLKNLAKNPKFKEGMMYGVDCWSEDPEKPEINDEGFSQQQLDMQYWQCIADFSTNPFVKIIRNFSYEASLIFPDEYFDFIYIDAAHDYNSMVEDVKAWWPKLKKGGVFSGHDYFPDERIWRGRKCEVYRAVNEFLEEKGLKVEHTTDTNKEGGPGVACNSFFTIK